MWTTGTRFSEIDVQAAPGAASVVALGDSITDGHGATTNGNDRWTDVLAGKTAGLAGNAQHRRIQPGYRRQSSCSPTAWDRMRWRASIATCSAPAGVRWVIVFEGVNDLGWTGARWRGARRRSIAALIERVLAAYQQIIDRAHAHGLHVIGATITPYVGSGLLSSRTTERGRQAGSEPLDSHCRKLRCGH